MSRISRFTAALAVASWVATAAFAGDDRYQTSFTREVPYRGGTVTIEHQFGSVNIDTGSSSTVSVRATVRASDPAFGQQIRIQAEPSGNGVHIRTHYPDVDRKGNFSYSVDYRVTVPSNARLKVQNRFGSITATGIAGGSELVNAHGSINLNGGRGTQTVENQFGSIQVQNLDGDAILTNSHGSVNAQRIRGAARVKNRFGSVTVSDVDRDATVENANGSATVRDVRGSAHVSSPFGTVSVQGVTGSVKATGSHSRVVVRDVRGDALVETAFGSITVENVGGKAGITNRNGNVKASGIARDLDVDTSFGSAVLSDIGGAIDVENQNGAISVSELRSSQCRPITLRTSFSTIKVALPATASYAVNARTAYGSIKSDLPIATRSVGEESVIGTIGGGACKLDLVNTNGNIRIEKE